MSKMFNIRDGHTWVEERLSAYIDGQLAPNERAQLENHMRDCARCQASLASLRWTISLLKQVPAPALPRSFTLPEPAKAARMSPTPRPMGGFALGFGALRVATALATLLLCVVVGADFILQFGGTTAPAFPPAARELAAPTQAALVPPATQPSAAKAQDAPTLSRVMEPATSSPQPTTAPPQLLAQPKSAATPTRTGEVPPPVAGAAETQSTPTRAAAAPLAPRTADGVTTTLATGTQTATPTPMRAAESSLKLAPTVTPTAPAPSVEARVEPTRIPPRSSFDSSRASAPSLRIVEVGLLALVIILGVLTFVVWRRK